MMADSDQQLTIPADQDKSTPRLAAIASDTYTLLLVVGLLILIISLAVLGYLGFKHYGLGGSKPVIGQITAVSGKLVQVDIGAKDGLQTSQTLSAIRRGVFLTELSIKSVDNTGCSAFPVVMGPEGKLVERSDDGQSITLAKGDTVVFSPLDSESKP